MILLFRSGIPQFLIFFEGQGKAQTSFICLKQLSSATIQEDIQWPNPDLVTEGKFCLLIATIAGFLSQLCATDLPNCRYRGRLTCAVFSRLREFISAVSMIING